MEKTVFPTARVYASVGISHDALAISFVLGEMALVSVAWGVSVDAMPFKLVARVLAVVKTSVRIVVLALAMVHARQPISDVIVEVVVNVSAEATRLWVNPSPLISRAIGPDKLSLALPGLCAYNPLANINSIWYNCGISVL